VRRRSPHPLLAVSLLALLLAVWVDSPAPAASADFKVFPGVGIGPIELGDTRSGLESSLAQPDPEGRTWAYTIRATGKTGVVMVRFDGQHAMAIFTFDRAFSYSDVGVGDDTDEAISVLRRAGFLLGHCGRARALFSLNRRTMFHLAGGEVESILVVSDSHRCRADGGPAGHRR
jgi:hypothetical protein